MGRYCHVCGQENTVPRESFGSLVLHFFYDITHFDGKFFQSLKYLLFKPGFLSKEYVRGRRTSYLHPVRMYVFTSAIFFLVFFLLVNVKGKLATVSEQAPLTNTQRVKMISDLEDELNKKESDTSILSRKLGLLKDTTRLVSNVDLLKVSFWTTDSNNRKYYNLREYDSVQSTLPLGEKDGWFTRMVIRKEIEMTNKFDGNVKEAVLEWVEIFLHKLPYLLFVSLPIFALILKLLYIRRRQFYYVDHGIFSIHHYILSFILLLAIVLLVAAKANYHFGWLTTLEVILFVVWPVHLYIAMLNFYKQGWLKTFVKFILLNILGFFSLLILFVVFLFFSIFGN